MAVPVPVYEPVYLPVPVYEPVYLPVPVYVPVYLSASACNQFSILLCILAVSKSISTIFISNLTRQQQHSSVASELYFQIECKSLNFPMVEPNPVKKIPAVH